jgi:hypothetical protein
LSRAAASILVFGLYLVILGTVFVLAPNALLSLVNLPPTQEVWIRLVGMLLLIMAFYYVMAARTETRAFFRWTLYTRLGAVVPVTACVVSGMITPIALLFWLGDLLGAIWTWTALHIEGKG